MRAPAFRFSAGERPDFFALRGRLWTWRATAESLTFLDAGDDGGVAYGAGAGSAGRMAARGSPAQARAPRRAPLTASVRNAQVG